jgi:hypothetical protein
MKMENTKRKSVAFRAIGVILATWALAAGAVSLAWANPQHDLEVVLNGTRRQAVKELDKQGLKLVLNEQMETVTLEGWSTKALTPQQADALLRQFGVRVVENAAEGTAEYIVPNNVGRAGILEGEVYMRLHGKVYKGLTLKGYGGNTVHGQDVQTMGSLEAAESIRDMEVSTILAESKVDTYVGVISVERPAAVGRYGGSATPKSNYVRLSRTALRMEDLIRVSPQDLPKLVDYLSNLMKDELGRKLSLPEFHEWLVKQTGDLLARKDYIRFQHASITDSNLGIGEMVDLGDEGGGLKLPGEYQPQNVGRGGWQKGFKDITRKVHDNFVKADPSLRSVDFDKFFDDAYSQRIEQLRSFDAARVNLNRATELELTKIGFTPAEAVEIVKYNLGAADGIIDPFEVRTIKTITRDVSSLLDRVTTDFVRLSDGSQLGAYYLRNVGGADGVRAILEEARAFMKKNGISLTRQPNGAIAGQTAALEAELGRLALQQAQRLGFERVAGANGLTNLSRFIARQALEVIVRR